MAARGERHAKGEGDTPDGFVFEGISIRLNREGEFVAEIGGEVVTKPSLKAMKQCIKENKLDTFKPFTALLTGSDVRGHGKVWERVTVVGFSRTKNRRWGALHEFLIRERPKDERRYGRTYTDLLVDTPLNIQILEQLAKYEAETERIDDQRRKTADAMKDRIRHVNIKDYAEDI